ncbi:succinyl-diaminopimelate desuccinylase [Legionella oakridgensis]|uniref:Succinyl-diaminopimelate desuccinylase n=2 Tax=Legionella oakridgensis TaxID=29423 RepID=W0BFI0_9GAMM|nr:succinyl-diaminopimelate desuccinylase [Legionella oakridgensis]AHE67446.1 succinyl-diaminopimelate desuccinylase, proteobacterial clade [Legionella oakridgensis ATCC 33761 = DSM 21215]ETO92976.1 succinyldiaminopimelate desuccinylase [Legionella oakridgensis RV-2-2007]KTD43504.1 succinyl-diaminopimelate desuccinylase [Legionella oakridgensis]STY20496.1 succinyl-diaminopimelate desuccinylase [Legionella longbeachae]
MNSLQELLTSLISYQSISPHDNGCQDFMIHYLEALGFHCQKFDSPPVANFFAIIGKRGPLLMFAGHTDVVPSGDLTKWLHDPFVLHQHNGLLYGRGTADMKGSLACMLIAASQFVKAHPDFPGRLAFLITSGEEGDHFNLGTPYVMSQLQQKGIHPDYCIVGEPSSSKRIGDVVKIGRRGSLTAKLVLHGKQGHVAYPQLAENPIHTISPVLVELVSTEWDKGNAFFPPTSLQITHIQSGGQASNIIPGELLLQFNFRYSTEQNAETLKQTVQTYFKRHGLQPLIEWRLNGEPFLTMKGRLLDACIEVITSQTGQTPELSTSGGTSDGRFIAPYGVEVIELGPVNETIHQVNECVALADLTILADMYYSLCKALLL